MHILNVKVWLELLLLKPTWLLVLRQDSFIIISHKTILFN